MQRLGYTADGYLWQLEYRDTVKLLQEKLVLFLRLDAGMSADFEVVVKGSMLSF
jgi:hypothetical protein